MSFVFKSTTLNAANIIYRVGRFKQYDNKWFKKITKLSKIIKKGHRYNLRQHRFKQRRLPPQDRRWRNHHLLYTINYITKGYDTLYQERQLFWPSALYHQVECFNHAHKNKFLFTENDWTKKMMIDYLKVNNIKYKKSWSKDKLYPLLFSF